MAPGDVGAPPGGQRPAPGPSTNEGAFSGDGWVLAAHASAHVARPWAPDAKVRLERALWVEVLGAQLELGLELDGGWRKLRAYETVAGIIDHASIRRRELVTRHDVKARIEEYNALAGYEAIHLGMTSADAVDNVALMQLRESMLEFARVHDVPRVASEARDLPFRGIKGAVGTQQDQVDLLGEDGACLLDQWVADRLGFHRVMGSVGQVYWRSVDLQVCSAVLSATLDVTANPWTEAARGYLTMVAAYQGNTWNEGDVSQSVVRRVALPGVLLACSAALTAVGR